MRGLKGEGGRFTVGGEQGHGRDYLPRRGKKNTSIRIIAPKHILSKGCRFFKGAHPNEKVKKKFENYEYIT